MTEILHNGALVCSGLVFGYIAARLHLGSKLKAEIAAIENKAAAASTPAAVDKNNDILTLWLGRQTDSGTGQIGNGLPCFVIKHEQNS